MHLKQFIYISFFIFVVFLVSGISICSARESQVINLPYNYISFQNNGVSFGNHYHSSGICQGKEERIASQDAGLDLGDKIQIQKNQTFSLGILKTALGLNNNKEIPIVFLENKDDSQTKQILTVVKKE